MKFSFAKQVSGILALALAVVSGSSCKSLTASDTMQITQSGKSSYVIVIPDKAEPVLVNSAKELSEHLQAVTGADFQVFENSQRPSGKPAFIIGNVDGLPEHDFAKAAPDTVSIDFDGKDIRLNGRLPRGPLYAVYEFLESYVGVRWWTKDETYIPNKPSLSVSRKNYLYSPSIISREAFYKDAEDATLAPRLKLNGHFSRASQDFGGKMHLIGWCHTSYQFLPPNKYFNDHPEWYSMHGNKREAANGQLCFTNKEMKKEFIKVCLENIRRDPTAGIISVSQNDWVGPCECPECQAVVNEEGSQSGPLIRFVNDVAEEICKEYPDFLIETLAYWYTRGAPKITKPSKHVVIRLCSIEMNFAQPLETGPANASFRNDIENWSAIAPNLYIWNYVTNFTNYMLPQPNWRSLAPDLRYFVSKNAIGVFEQGDIACNLGDFVRARAWILAHLLWNPQLDEKELTQEFFNGYYGAAAPFLLDYINFLCDKVEEYNYNLRCYNTNTFGWLRQEDIVQAYELYAKAEEAAKGDAKLEEKVRRERLTLDVATLKYIPILNARYGKKVDAATIGIPYEPEDLAKQLIELADKWHVGDIREGVPFGNYGKDQLAIATKPYEPRKHWKGQVPECCQGLPENSWEHYTVNEFKLFKENEWSYKVQDANSKSGTVAMMPASHTQWAVQIPLEGFDTTKKWKIRYAVRCDAANKSGAALTFGIYNGTIIYAGKSIHVDEIAGEKYTVFETDPIPLDFTQYAYFAPCARNQQDVSSVYIDYVTVYPAE